MPLTDAEVQHARDIITRAARPLIFHDDDCDGVCSFILATTIAPDAKGVPVKNSPTVTAEYLRKVEEIGPDLIVILDKPRVDEEFLAKLQTPVLWLDHHEPQTELASKYRNLTYLNPRNHDDADNRPTSFWMHRIARERLWLAAVGTVGDWHVPDFLPEFKERYPELLTTDSRRVEDLYLSTPIGTLIRVIQFNLKGTPADVRSSISTLAKIQEPDEILKQTTTRGKLLWKRYQRLAQPYETMLHQAIEAAKTPGPILKFLYEDPVNTFTPELSNELLIRYPEKVILVGRKHDGKWKCSVRSKEVELPTKIQASLAGLDGHGGGHRNACGLVVRVEQWDDFYSRFSQMVEKDVAKE